MTEPLKRFKPNTKMVPVPSRSIIPERDVNHSPVLEASHLGIEFGGLKAVDDVNLAIGRTEICGLIGPNGAGKTTVFNLLTKVYQPTTGTVLINGKDTAGMNTVQASKLGIARTFQNIRLFDNMTVEENVRIGLHNQIKYGMFSGIFRLPQYWQGEKKQHEKALDLLSIFGMENMGDVKAGSLPYGAQRRLEIVRALATNPEIIYFDEPTSALDPISTSKIEDLAMELKKDYTIVMVTHNMQQAVRVSDNTAFFLLGEVIEYNDTEKLFSIPEDKRTEDYITGRFG
jgi:branched-chain amino acid transport system ATP-binding protein